MTSNSTLGSKLLPVSILTGPSVHALVEDIVAADQKCRFGFLVSAKHGQAKVASLSETVPSRLMVEDLLETSHHGYDPGQISTQIASFAEKGMVDHLLVECDSRTHPLAFASLFFPQSGEASPLPDLARLASLIFAINVEDVLPSLVGGSRPSDLPSPCRLADQIEAASLIVLRGNSAPSDLALARSVVSALNPRAQIVELSQNGIIGKLLDVANSFDFASAAEGAAWRKVAETKTHASAADGQRVTTFTYHARRPFHPERLLNLLQNRLSGVLRAQGYFWLATRMNLVGGLNVAGSEYQHMPAGEWWAARAPADGSGPAEIPDRLKKVWVEPFGDRRQDIVFLGLGLDAASLGSQLDACLLDDSEFAAGEESWASLPDRFPAWSTHKHDHDCEEHDCGHHH